MNKDLIFAVAVSTFNRNEDLARCLEALRKQTYKDFEVIVSNGGDYAGVKNVVEHFGDLRIKVVNQQRKGIVEGRNLGWRNAPADIVCFIDDDLIVSGQWLENIRQTFLSDDWIGGVSGPTIIPDDRKNNRDFALFLEQFKTAKNILVRLIGKIYLSLVLENKITEVGRILKSGAFTPGSNFKSCLSIPGPIEVDYAEACHMCFRKVILERIDGFDYAYTGTGEWNEPDFSFQVRRLGYRLIFNPRAVTEHHISQSGVFSARTYAYERSRNFIHFYFENVKPNSLDKILRFAINLCFINAYWCYKFIQTRKPDWLKGISGTLAGLAREICG